MKHTMQKLILCSGLVGFAFFAQAALIEKPTGPMVDRNIELAAESAIQTWIGSLKEAPRFDKVSNVGVLALGGDGHQFTATLSDTLSRNPQLRVVVLRGPAWDAVENELARQDPDGGWGDIMDKASIAWQENRGSFALPESALGADALLMGQIRSVDSDWLRARVRLNLRLVKVDTREVIAGGVVEGESMLSLKDFAIYYKSQLLVLLGVLFVLSLFRRFVKGMQKPR